MRLFWGERLVSFYMKFAVTHLKLKCNYSTKFLLIKKKMVGVVGFEPTQPEGN
jgi:hypothetical protein